MAKLLLHDGVSDRQQPGQLPSEATSFVGRTTELRDLAALLRSVRLVTLAGPPGVGKTRLAQRVAARCADWFPDGAWLVELSGQHDPRSLWNAVARALGLPGQDAPSPRAAVLDHLGDRRLLLILDTCEHLVDGCAELAELVLKTAQGVTLLATSRQPLDVPGEHVFGVPPLPPEAEAVELFAHRAAASAPGFEVTPANRADVSRLCRHLDGIPLAIELATVRLRALPLPELARRLRAGFGVLAASRRGINERHQTLRAAIDWSHGLCTPAEQALWARLSVFAGSFDITVAEEVCADDELPRGEVIHALVGLVDKSMLLRLCDEAGEGSGDEGDRYRMLGTIREFGAERLAARGEREVFRDRYEAARARGARAQDAAVAGSASRHAADGEPPTPASPGPGFGVGPPPVLTRREREIAELVASGLSNREIADRLFISKRTVDAHVEHIFGKLEISSRIQLTVLVHHRLPA